MQESPSITFWDHPPMWTTVAQCPPSPVLRGSSVANLMKHNTLLYSICLNKMLRIALKLYFKFYLCVLVHYKSLYPSIWLIIRADCDDFLWEQNHLSWNLSSGTKPDLAARGGSGILGYNVILLTAALSDRFRDGSYHNCFSFCLCLCPEFSSFSLP